MFKDLLTRLKSQDERCGLAAAFLISLGIVSAIGLLMMWGGLLGLKEPDITTWNLSDFIVDYQPWLTLIAVFLLVCAVIFRYVPVRFSVSSAEKSSRQSLSSNGGKKN